MRSISTLSFESYRKTFLSKTSLGNSSKGAARFDHHSHGLAGFCQINKAEVPSERILIVD